MPDGIQFARVAYPFAVEYRACISGATNGRARGAKKRRWPNVLVYQQVSHLFHSSIASTYASDNTSEKFETKDMRWAPDGKGFILFGKDQFCCAFEVLDDVQDASGEPGHTQT